MCTFGEIFEPSSRSFWDDEYSEDDEQYQRLEFKWKSEQPDLPQTVDTFVLFEGVLACRLAKKCITKNLQPYCTSNVEKISMYRVPDLNIEICLAESLDPTRAGEVTEILSPWISIASKTVAFTLKNIRYFFTDEKSCLNDPCVIRSLHTDRTPENLIKIKILPVPNFVDGLAAGVISWRQFNVLAGSLYCCYIDNDVLDSKNCGPIINLIQLYNVPCDDYQHNAPGTSQLSSNLYM